MVNCAGYKKIIKTTKELLKIIYMSLYQIVHQMMIFLYMIMNKLYYVVVKQFIVLNI